jgi:putative hydrolase of the HAD superfamily
MAQSSPSQSLAITAIAFDLGNVLIRVDHGRFCRRLGELAGIAPGDVYGAVFESDLEPDYDAGRLSSQEFYQEVCRLFQIDLPFPLFCEWWQDIFDPMEGMEEVVEALTALYPLFLLSNTNAIHFPYIYRCFPLLGRLRRFILSYQVGSRKPEPAIYQALIQEIDRPPEQCLFVDDKAPFVEAAKTHGLTAWQFTSVQDFIDRLRQHGLYEPES